ncbi:hypothetical protein [Roseobacter sp. N2S]|uniref:hypothetical protein n=1 Tax=Roseobacter sp. N2S TaxID=2663844 RepID=UPI0028601AEC|nr:hypothetical protein [Roseobacter sp. N2S]MDR6265288.1 hypothetical protein [Roseobacter sp. N2S]
MTVARIFGKNGVLIALAAALAAILSIWAFPEKACSLFYSDDVFQASTPISVCRAQVQWRTYSPQAEVASTVQNGQLRNFGDQCYAHSECLPGGDGSPRCVPLDNQISDSPRFCLSRDKNCSFPGLPGLNNETMYTGPYEAQFGQAEYYCERETDGTNTIRHFVARK